MLVGRPSHRWSSSGLTPFLGRPGQCEYFCSHQREDVWPPTYDLTCNRPDTRQIFSGIGFELGALRPRSRDHATTPPRPLCLRSSALATWCIVLSDDLGN
ncbi:hypothetical protein AVEN_221578-1 [Araneus ventricosus]|uniref:Uncharacterized protein n=1 Tax=Araneus ventricosus TaxID=182803 RepID=A0A4Y2F856_ARAVE|nr:hypothetical protein AVEN_221578-1 [Araneus ventricosus]